MKKSAILILVLIVIISTLLSCCYASSWVDQGYNWAKNNNIISTKTTNQLLSDMSISDYYTMLFKYFDYKLIEPSIIFYKAEDYKADNYILVATDRELTALAKKDWITNNEYKKANTLIENARNILAKNEKYFTKDEITSIKYYLDNIHYILYSKIYDYTYKSQIYVPKTNVSDKFMQYRMIPCYGNITREEFLNLMYYYTRAYKREDTNKLTFTTAEMIDFYTEEQVLLGYNYNLMLTARMSYAHFVTFLSRLQSVTFTIG